MEQWEWSEHFPELWKDGYKDDICGQPHGHPCDLMSPTSVT